MKNNNTVAVKKVKKIKFEGKDGRTGYGHLVFCGDTVGYHHVCGPMPQARMIMAALLCDHDGYRAAKRYINNNRKHLFELLRTDGMSGSIDYRIQIYETYMGFNVKGMNKHLLHVSMYGTLNKGLDPLYIGDLVEIASDYLLMWEGCGRNRREREKEGAGLKVKKLKRELLRDYGMKYIPEFRTYPISVASTATNIFS